MIVLLMLGSINAAYGLDMLNISEGSQWRYFKGVHDPPKNWHHNGFDDSSWLKGVSGFGYGTGKNETVLADMKGKYQTVYVRHDFAVSDYHKITRLMISIVCDGPFAAYFNNIEIIRSNKPQKGELLDMIGFAHELDHGTNTLSFKCSNDHIDSDDFTFLPSFQYSEQ